MPARVWGGQSGLPAPGTTTPSPQGWAFDQSRLSLPLARPTDPQGFDLCHQDPAGASPSPETPERAREPASGAGSPATPGRAWRVLGRGCSPRRLGLVQSQVPASLVSQSSPDDSQPAPATGSRAAWGEVGPPPCPASPEGGCTRLSTPSSSEHLLANPEGHSPHQRDLSEASAVPLCPPADSGERLHTPWTDLGPQGPLQGALLASPLLPRTGRRRLRPAQSSFPDAPGSPDAVPGQCSPLPSASCPLSGDPPPGLGRETKHDLSPMFRGQCPSLWAAVTLPTSGGHIRSREQTRRRL